MNWKNLFAMHILDRGYDYYVEGAVKNIEISNEIITANVTGSDDYDVEIYLHNGKVKSMYCSCPYAFDGRNCKHMAAVLYEWSNNECKKKKYKSPIKDLFIPADTIESYNKKEAAVTKLVRSASEDDVYSFLITALAKDEKLLLDFYGKTNKNLTKKDVNYCIKQINMITNKYLGRDHFISYNKASNFISELKDIIHEDVRQMIDDGSYLNAFKVMNYIFVLLGQVDMDDSDGCTGFIAEDIYQLWLELLEKVNIEEKQKMYDWFNSHLDGSLNDYLEEYIKKIIMEEFEGKDYRQEELVSILYRIDRDELINDDLSREQVVGKWAVEYLELLMEKRAADEQIQEVFQKYWKCTAVRGLYIDYWMKKKDYDRVLQTLNESILLDKEYSGLVAEYQEKKKEIYLLQGNKRAYIEQLWQLILEQKPGDLELFRELKSQYSEAEWIIKREELFKRLPSNADIDKLYEEEKLYDKLLEYVINYPGLDALENYDIVLANDYPLQILNKYKDELNKMTIRPSNREKYADMVLFLHRMKHFKGGLEVVEEIVLEWKTKYNNRRAMMDELRKFEA